MPASKYDWDGWFASSPLMLLAGVHYDCSQSAMCQQVRSAASHRGLLVSVEDLGNRIVVTVERKETASA